MKDKSHEWTYLVDLLSDFSVNPDSNVEEAITLIQARYTVLLRNIDVFSSLLSLPKTDGDLPATVLPSMMHHFLYRDILSNAGKYRRSSERNNGNVFFGLRQEFSGTLPSQIETETKEIFSSLQLERSDDSVRGAAEFYQRFVQIHPFYDANGRIGRAIVTAYLDLHGLFMNWEAMERNSIWLKRLNHCHRRYGDPSYDTYLGYHVTHWQKFIVAKDNIYSDDDMSEFMP